MALIAYHGDQAVKDAIIAQIEAHRAAGDLVKGQYWENGKGCAVGCTIHSGDHTKYETRFGIPQMLAHLKDPIFEGLPNAAAQDWPVMFMSAIRPGADLSLVGWRFLHWLLTDATVNPGINHPLVRDAVAQCAEVVAPLANGKRADQWADADAATWAAWEVRSAAARAAETARRGRAAREAWQPNGAAWIEAYCRMADKLVELLEVA